MARALAALLLALTVSASPGAVGAGAGATRIRLVEAGTGRVLLSCVLAEGERAVLTWKNSLFGLMVTEVFVARAGGLELSSVTFAGPDGREPPLLRPEDLDDVYHTGGPFRVEGLSRPIGRVVFRVGEIGDPALRAGARRLRFLEAVGFGGAVVLEATPGRPPAGDAGPGVPSCG